MGTDIVESAKDLVDPKEIQKNPIIGFIVGVVVGLIVGYAYEQVDTGEPKEDLMIGGYAVKFQTMVFSILAIIIAILGAVTKKNGVITFAVGFWVGGYVADTQW